MRDTPAPPIQVWAFYDAPAELRDLSENGGDEDWLVVFPAGYNFCDGFYYFPWLASMDSGRDPERHELPGGRIVFIGSHA